MLSALKPTIPEIKIFEIVDKFFKKSNMSRQNFHKAPNSCFNNPSGSEGEGSGKNKVARQHDDSGVHTAEHVLTPTRQG